MTVKTISEILEQARTLADNLQNQMLTLVQTLNPRQVNLHIADLQ